MDGIEVAALTSYSMQSLKDKIYELVPLGVRKLDLYCFFPEDLRVLCELPRDPDSFRVGMEHFNPSVAAQKIRAWCREAEERYPGDKIDVCGIASFIPDVSSIHTDRRERAVGHLVKLINFMKELRQGGFSCDTFELVAGHTIQAVPEGIGCKAAQVNTDKKSSHTYLQYVSEQDCLANLLDSLEKLCKAIGSVGDKWPRGTNSRSDVPVLAIELEPSISRFVHNRRTVSLVLAATKHLESIGLNVDIGHMRIVDITPGTIKRSRSWRSRAVHCHVSDNAHSHFADLEVESFMSQSEYIAWFTTLQEWRKDGGPFLGRVSIEMEACGDAKKVASCYAKVCDWVKKLPAC